MTSNIRITKALRECRVAGRLGNYDAIVRICNTALSLFDDDDGTDLQDDNNKATLYGYKGFALMKLSNYTDAIPMLEKSHAIHVGRPVVGGAQKMISSSSSRGRREQREVIAVEQALNCCYRETNTEAPLPPLVKFPRTTHLFDTGGTSVTNDDLVVSGGDLTAVQSICDGMTQVIIEEKIDGANLGFSLSLSGQILVQNRSHYICPKEQKQFSNLYEWIEKHREGIVSVLNMQERPSNTILFGEWVVAKHSLPYGKLPNYFIAFDIYDKEKNHFLSRKSFHSIMKATRIPVAPIVAVRTFGPYKDSRSKKLPRRMKADLNALLETKSVFRSDGGTLEGIVLRVDGAEISNRYATECAADVLLHKWKVVRPDFIGGCQKHWTRHKIEKQVLDYNFVDDYLANCYVFANAEDLSPSNEEGGKDETERKLQGRKQRRIPRCILLSGLPGSGKTTFASSVASSSSLSPSWTVVNQDRMGRKECVEVAGSACQKNRIIVDRCAVSEDERFEWYQILHSPPRGEIALIYFATNVDTCVERAKGRVAHETIPFGRGERIVRDLAKRLQPPTRKETKDLFGVVEIINSIEDSNEILRRWGCL